MAEDVEKEGEADGAEAEAGKSKPDIKKLALFIGLPAVILILAGVAGALLLLGGGEDEVDVAAAEAAETAALEQQTYMDRMATASPLDEPITVSLVGTGRRTTIIVSFQVAYQDARVAEQLADPMRRQVLRDSYLEFLRTLRPEDLDGSMGHFRFKAELVRRTNLIIAPLEVDDVLFDEFMMQ